MPGFEDKVRTALETHFLGGEKILSEQLLSSVHQVIMERGPAIRESLRAGLAEGVTDPAQTTNYDRLIKIIDLAHPENPNQ